jgi:DNA topoisomerase-3
MLAKRKPVLIAIEEAQRVIASAGNRDADYALLSRHLPLPRPAPVLALTSAQDAETQKQIASLLGLINLG